MSFKVDESSFKRVLNSIDRGVDRAWSDTGKYYKRITPRDQGNAQRNTKKRNNKIIADYAYAARLDAGWSKQAPNGMTEPALDAFEEFIANRLRNI